MSFGIVGLHCQEGVLKLGDGIPDLVMRAEHEHCPGGHHMPGVLGGWHCTCPCHRDANAANARSISLDSGE